MTAEISISTTLAVEGFISEKSINYYLLSLLIRQISKLLSHTFIWSYSCAAKMKMVINVFLAPAYFSVLLLSYFSAHAFLPTFRSSYQLSYKKDPLYRPLQQTEPDEFFNENDDILSGDPIWFNPSAQRDISTTILEKGIIDNNVILRSLPLYLLHDGQCFPTGL